MNYRKIYWEKVLRKLYSLYSSLMVTFSLAVVIMFHNITFCYAESWDPQREAKIRNSLRSILSSSEFSQSTGRKSLIQSVADMMKGLYDWIMNMVNKLRLLDRPSKSVGGQISEGTGIFLRITGIILLLAFFTTLVFFVFRNIRISRGIKQKEDAELLQMIKDPELVEQKALEYSKNGDFRQGLRLLYIALILKLNEANLLKIDKAKTNRQYLNELRENGFNGYEDVEEFTRVFNQCWYGNRSVNSDKFSLWYGRYSGIVRMVAA